MKLLYGFLCLFFLILIHEIGHFVAAKLFSVRVESFSIGFGPVLLHRKHNGTDYRLSLIPLGGYCGMKGEKDFQKALDAGLDCIEAEKDSMYGVNPIKRAIIAFAGPFSNLAFTFFSFFIISLTGYTYYSYSSKIIIADELYPEVHSSAKEAGLRTGDIITKINSRNIVNFSDIVMEVSSRPDEDIVIEINRNGSHLQFKVHTDFDKSSGSGKIGITADKDSIQKYEAPRYSFFPGIINGIKETASALRITMSGLGSLFKGVELEKTVSGPARIADMLGTVVTESFSENFRAGIVNMLNLLAYISISLFIMNLLPVPVLDGGLIIFAMAEFISRRKISPKVLYYIQFIGLAFIGILFVIGLSGDIKYFMNDFRGIQR